MSSEPTQPRRPRLPDPGWLPDPAQLDLERYWDGARWTSRTRDRGSKMERVPLGDVHRGGRSYDSGGTRGGARGGTRRAAAWLAVGAGIGVFVAGYYGALPAWVPWPSEMTAGVPDGPEVAYPVFGSDPLVEYLARSMIAQDDAIDLGFLGPMDASTAARVEDAWFEASTQNPYVFVEGMTIETQGLTGSIRPDYVYDDDAAEARRVATASAVAALVQTAGADPSQPEGTRVELIHDAIAQTATYDFEAFDAISAGGTSPAVAASQEAYGILVSHTAVCTGYAEAFLLAADALGLDAVVVTGEVNDGPTIGLHAWNRVLVDGVWRVVDVTWDDLDSPDGQVSRDYLLVSDGHPLLDSRTADAAWMRDEAIGLYS